MARKLPILLEDKLTNIMVQDTIIQRMGMLLYLFREHILTRASSVMEEALAPNSASQGGLYKLAWNISVDPENYSIRKEELEDIAVDLLERLQMGDVDGIREFYQRLSTGQFTTSKVMESVMKRPLSIPKHLDSYATTLANLESDIDATYNQHAIVAYANGIEKIPLFRMNPDSILKEYHAATAKVNKEFKEEKYDEIENIIATTFTKFVGHEIEKGVSISEDTYMGKLYSEFKHAKRYVHSGEFKLDSLEHNDEKTDESPTKSTLAEEYSEIYQRMFGIQPTQNVLNLFYQYYQRVYSSEEKAFIDVKMEQGKDMIKNSPDVQKLSAELSRGGNKSIPDDITDTLARFYGQEQKAIVKFGVDPTGSELHLGHAVPMYLLRKMQENGYVVTLLIGDWTGQIGDPSGRSKERTLISPEIIKDNALMFYDQAIKVLDAKRLNVIYNGTWFDPLGALDLRHILGSANVKELQNRPEFQRRMEQDGALSVDELTYALYQGMDSVMLGSHFEVGAKDQLTNMLKGRELQDKYGIKPQTLIMTPQLTGIRGVEKMSKSLENGIGITEPPNKMYSDIMKMSDMNIEQYYELLTTEDPVKISRIRQSLGLNLLLEQLSRTAAKLTEKEGVDHSRVTHYDALGGKDYEEKLNGSKLLGPIYKEINDWVRSENPDARYSIHLRKAPRKDLNDYIAKILPWDEDSKRTLDIIAARAGLDPVRGMIADESSEYNPKNIKQNLAYLITAFFHGEDAAQKAEMNFERVYSEKMAPKDLEIYKPTNPDAIASSDYKIIELIHDYGKSIGDDSLSKSEIKQRIKNKGVKVIISKDEEYLVDKFDFVLPEGQFLVKYGKGKFFKTTN